jgi:hypothetical protein
MSHYSGDDDSHLVRFGYKPRLQRSLGVWHAFSVSYGWVAILTGISALFYLGYGNGGPAFFWVYPIVGLITALIALCMAEMAGQVPVEGSIRSSSSAGQKTSALPSRRTVRSTRSSSAGSP